MSFLKHSDFNPTERHFVVSDVGKGNKQAGQHWLHLDMKITDNNGKSRLIDKEFPKYKDADNKAI